LEELKPKNEDFRNSASPNIDSLQRSRGPYATNANCIQGGVIYRTDEPVRIASESSPPAWELFVASQQATFTHLVSQPAHAALAGQLSGFLKQAAFGPIPQEVIAVIGRHDRGWFEPDSAAIEQSDRTLPKSFLVVAPEDAIQAWRASIRSAERQSLLAGILTSRHFCLLAPQNNAVHHQFWKEETERRELIERGYSEFSDLDRFTAAMGFCDLLSLFLCSGVEERAMLPLAHPANPESRKAPQLTIKVSGPVATFEPMPFQTPATVHVQSWLREGGSKLRHQQIEWTLN
jgi:Protein of unknown function (DUF3891)